MVPNRGRLSSKEEMLHGHVWTRMVMCVPLGTPMLSGMRAVSAFTRFLWLSQDENGEKSAVQLSPPNWRIAHSESQSVVRVEGANAGMISTPHTVVLSRFVQDLSAPVL